LRGSLHYNAEQTLITGKAGRIKGMPCNQRLRDVSRLLSARSALGVPHFGAPKAPAGAMTWHAV
jgi:hypothetical protein